MTNLQIVILVACLLYNRVACQLFRVGCSSDLGMESGTIKRYQLSSNTNRRGWNADEGRLRNSKAWCSKTNDNTSEYFQIDLLRVRQVSAIATQGFESKRDYYVETYTIKYSYDGAMWFYYEAENGADVIFTGNSNASTIKRNSFRDTFVTRYLRICPKRFHRIMCLRVEVYGCSDQDDDCSRYITSTTGSITSPGHPVSYPSNKDCTWLILVARGKQIALMFTTFDVKRGSSAHVCQEDFVEVRNGLTDTSHQIGGKYCNGNKPVLITTQRNFVRIHFHSGSLPINVSYKGFQIRYDSVTPGSDDVLAGKGCDGDTVVLNCSSSDYTIDILHASYGSYRYSCGQQYTSIKCPVLDVKSDIATKCQDYKECHISLSGSLFGYSCPNNPARRQLEVFYQCTSRNIKTSTTMPPNNTSPPAGALQLDVCYNYAILSGGDRAQGSTLKGNYSCDLYELAGWYRFQGAAGDRMPDKCVPEGHCGTDASGWMQGNHPTVAEGVVTRKVCYHFSDNCCLWSNNISVRNCGEYFVYKLGDPPGCNARYCGNGGAVTTASILSPTTTLPRTRTPPPRAPPSIYYVDPPTETGTEENVTLTCYASGLPQPTFTWITPDGYAVNATAPVNESEVLDNGSENRRGKIVQEDGSLLIFNTRIADQGVYKCVAINVVGQDDKTVNLTVKEDLVGVDVAITIEDEDFDKDLENKSSARYKKLEEQVEQQLTELFKEIEGFEKVVILGFFNGSVKVRFRVVVNVDELEDKELLAIANKVGKTLRNSVQTGQIGNLKVKKTVELRELPPPPVNVQSSDVKQTEAVVTWSHPEFYDMYAISSYSLQVRKFGTKTWTQLATTRGVNHRLSNLHPDTVYFVRLKSENKYGKGNPSDSGELRTEKVPEGHQLMLALGIIFVLLLVIMGIAAVFVYRRWKKKRNKNGNNNPEEEVPMNPVTAKPTETNTLTSKVQASFPWREIPRDRLTLGKILGEGEFGMVVKGNLTEDDGHITPCAVKKLKDCATESDLKDLKNELDIMDSVGHHSNLVNLIGACSSEGQLMIVVEFAEHGNLHRYLRDHRKQNFDDMNKYSLDISSTERLRIACDVAEGMKHLATMRWVHRDLAARNVLLGEGMVAKVADFGLTRDLYTTDVYEKKSGGKVPVKWLAVESLQQALYTSQSDVWSFGVLLWEIETGGCTPYAGISTRKLLPHLKAGNRLEKPHYCSPELYSVMLGCWNANPKNRPTFEELRDELHQMRTKVTEYLTPVEMEPSNDYLTLIL